MPPWSVFGSRNAAGNLADIVLGYDDCNGYRTANGACLGATVGRNANRLKNAQFSLNGAEYTLAKNDGENNLHSGPDHFHLRLWKTIRQTPASVTFELNSPHGDQGFPGNAAIQVTYELDHEGTLHIIYHPEWPQPITKAGQQYHSETIFRFSK